MTRFEELCAKMGYNPMITSVFDVPGYDKDDSPRPSSKLTDDELDYVIAYMEQHQSERQV